MSQPQSGEDVSRVVDELKLIDPLLDVRWEPKAIMTKRGSYDVLGGRTDPTYRGLWQVIRWDKSTSLHEDRDYVVVTNVTELAQDDGGPPMMRDGGAYAPLGSWLVAHMRYWDGAQAAFAEHMAAAWKQHERAEALDLTNERAMNHEALEKVYREHGGGEYWMGRGFGGGTATRRPQTNASSLITSSTE